MSDWYLAENGERVGPLSAQEIENGVKSRRYTGDTLAWREGFADWQPLRSIAEFAGSFSAPPSPPPPNISSRPLPPPSASPPRAKTTAFQAVSNTIVAILFVAGGVFWIWNHFKTKHHDDAVEHYNNAVNYEQVHEDKLALANYNEAIDADGEFIPAYLNRGVIKVEKGDTAGGLADMQRVIAIAREHPPGERDYLEMEAVAKATLNNGLNRLWKGDTTYAFAVFDSLIRTYQGPEGAYLQRGLIKLARHDTAAAQNDLSAATNAMPKYVDVLSPEFSSRRDRPSMDVRRAYLFLAALALAHNNRGTAMMDLNMPGMDELPDAVRIKKQLNQ